MSNNSKSVDDVGFVISEIFRFHSMPVHDLFAHLESNKRDRLCSVPHPDGQGILICGRDALERLMGLAEGYLLSRDAERRIDIKVYFHRLIDEFVLRFLKETRKVDQQNVDRMLASALKKVKAKHQSLTHFIPCIVVFESEPPEFRIGPVHFKWMEKFLSDNKKEIEEQRSKNIGDQLVDGLFEYYSEFKWMASVTVPESDKAVSRERAEVAVEGALDVLKLFLGTSYGITLRQGHSRGIPRRTASLTRKSTGDLNISIGWGARDAMVGPGWFKVLTEPDSFYLQAAGSMLYACIDDKQSTDLNRRFLDALTWYGQAILEAMPSAKIIKNVAALERLTLTSKVDDISNSVSRRIATLLNNGGDKEEFDHSYSNAKKVYDFRSGLMHGSISPFDKRLVKIAPLAERITRDTLLRSLDLFVAIQSEIKDRPASRSDLEQRYNTLGLQFPS